jgi:apolipoprotein N-acyltransferase
MAHVAPTPHRRAAHASHRSTPHTSHRGTSSTPDGPVLTATWLGLTFGMILGLVLVSWGHIGVRAAGFTLLFMLVLLTVAVSAAALRRGIGSDRAALSTGVALTFVVLKFLLS